MELSLTEFVLGVILGSGAVIALLSLVSWALTRQSENHVLRRRVICRLCLHAYEEIEHTDLSECPNCHTHNDRNITP